MDKFNIIIGVLAILLLGGALGVQVLPPAAHIPLLLASLMRWSGLVAMALYVITLVLLNRDWFRSAAGMRTTKAGTNSVFFTLGVLAILVAVNYLGSVHHTRFDLTQNKQYSLSPQTDKILKNLKDPVKVSLFIKKGDPSSDNLKHLWEEYSYANPDKLKLDVVDVDQNPMLAKADKITAYGTSVLQRGTRTTTITGNQEQDLTSAILKVTEDGQKVVYFTTGHGELGIDKFDPTGISDAKDALTKQNYKVDTLDLFANKDVPSDADLVVIAGPTKPLLPQEKATLERYIDRGGKVFLALQPLTNPQIEDFTEHYGIVVHNDLVIDPRMVRYGDPANIPADHFPFHTITQGLQMATFKNARSLDKLAKLPEGVNITPLVQSDAAAWGETNLMDRHVQYDPGKDTKGPVEMMLLAEKGQGKLIVSGSTLFLANLNYMNYNNGDLFLNALNWMGDNQDLVSIPPKDNAPKTVDLMPWQFTGIFYGTVLAYPLLLLLFGGLVWWRRR
ncbi:MAG TPA: GldG family protein [Oscillatoriaceae cyanobacterium]